MDTFGLCSLTEGKNKLASVSGVAASFLKSFDDFYLAGLWEKDLAFGLSWLAQGEQRVLKPARHAGPSWSWTSTNRFFRYPLTDTPSHEEHVPWAA
jgi:hypothetical protein